MSSICKKQGKRNWKKIGTPPHTITTDYFTKIYINVLTLNYQPGVYRWALQRAAIYAELSCLGSDLGKVPAAHHPNPCSAFSGCLLVSDPIQNSPHHESIHTLAPRYLLDLLHPPKQECSLMLAEPSVLHPLLLETIFLEKSPMFPPSEG